MFPVACLPRNRRITSGGVEPVPVSLSGFINGWTVAPYPAQPPINLYLDFSSLTATNFAIRFSFNGVFYDVTFASGDPGDGSHWIDNSAFTVSSEYANALAGWVNTTFDPAFTGDLDVATTIIIAANTGASVSMFVDGITGTSEIVVTGGGSGSDAIPASGQVDTATLASAVSGKSIRLNANESAFSLSSISAWAGLVMLEYLGDTLAVLLSFNPSGLSDGSYSLNDLAAVPGAFLDAGVLASGLSNAAVRLVFVPASDPDTDFAGGIISVSGNAIAS